MSLRPSSPQNAPYSKPRIQSTRDSGLLLRRETMKGEHPGFGGFIARTVCNRDRYRVCSRNGRSIERALVDIKSRFLARALPLEFRFGALRESGVCAVTGLCHHAHCKRCSGAHNRRREDCGAQNRHSGIHRESDRFGILHTFLGIAYEESVCNTPLERDLETEFPIGIGCCHCEFAIRTIGLNREELEIRVCGGHAADGCFASAHRSGFFIERNRAIGWSRSLPQHPYGCLPEDFLRIRFVTDRYRLLSGSLEHDCEREHLLTTVGRLKTDRSARHDGIGIRCFHDHAVHVVLHALAAAFERRNREIVLLVHMERRFTVADLHIERMNEAVSLISGGLSRRRRTAVFIEEARADELAKEQSDRIATTLSGCCCRRRVRIENFECEFRSSSRSRIRLNKLNRCNSNFLGSEEEMAVSRRIRFPFLNRTVAGNNDK